ncbi:MAG: D-aminoacyl-tRNA deacylase [Bacteroidales bacterium]
MRVLIQRVTQSSLSIDYKIYSEIGQGLLVLIGICDTDLPEDIDYLVKKVSSLRIFDDENGVMNKSVLEISAEVMVVSQFTLMANTKKGNRPSYIRASKSNISKPLYEKFVETLKDRLDSTSSAILSNTSKVKTGVFGADMKINLINDGPVTIMIDSKQREF